ncbi:MAG: TraX family protein [Lacrimispora sp.]|uniref:TraX family protein n=1 Tax=Lacrimispora sp. TaxID=2719234 RepID=UPI0039E5C841
MYETGTASVKGITGNTLKMVAIVTMFLDHAGVVLVAGGILGDNVIQEGSLWPLAYVVLRTIGRLAFPIFCFLLTEGFLHTRDVKKYGIRLLAFAFISEVPFDLAIFDRWFQPGYQNVYFTLFLGLCVLYFYDKAAGNSVKQGLIALAGMAIASFIRSDYDAIGIGMILIFYVFRGNKKLQTLFGGMLAVVSSLSLSGAAALAFIPIRMYNGKRGEKNLKQFFYWFYPVHLLLLYLLRLSIT